MGGGLVDKKIKECREGEHHISSRTVCEGWSGKLGLSTSGVKIAEEGRELDRNDFQKVETHHHCE